MRNLLILTTLLCAIANAQDHKPNIVVIMVDNLGWGELGCYGGGVLRGAEATWVMPVIMKKIVAFRKTLMEEPPIRLGTPDPYVPPRRK